MKQVGQIVIWLMIFLAGLIIITSFVTREVLNTLVAGMK